MEEWMQADCRLGLLVDPVNKRVFVYRQKRAVEEVPYQTVISGEDVLTGFTVCPAEVDR